MRKITTRVVLSAREDLSDPTSDTNLVIVPTNDAAFYRILGQ
jgi:hypothetical protein